MIWAKILLVCVVKTRTSSELSPLSAPPNGLDRCVVSIPHASGYSLCCPCDCWHHCWYHHCWLRPAAPVGGPYVTLGTASIGSTAIGITTPSDATDMFASLPPPHWRHQHSTLLSAPRLLTRYRHHRLAPYVASVPARFRILPMHLLRPRPNGFDKRVVSVLHISGYTSCRPHGFSHAALGTTNLIGVVGFSTRWTRFTGLCRFPSSRFGHRSFLEVLPLRVPAR